MTIAAIQHAMLLQVAQALGPELCQQVVFAGGCTTALLVTDDFTREGVRHTNDVDLIISLKGTVEYHKLQRRLRQQGFRDASHQEDVPQGAMFLGDLRVDFMPDDEKILGFTNRWYRAALETATDYPLDQTTAIRLIDPVYFAATKVEAWLGRGSNDPLASQDIEDLLNLVDGRSVWLQEVAKAPAQVRGYLAEQIAALLEHRDIEYAIQGASQGDAPRARLIHDRLLQVTAHRGAV